MIDVSPDGGVAGTACGDGCGEAASAVPPTSTTPPAAPIPASSPRRVMFKPGLSCTAVPPSVTDNWRHHDTLPFVWTEAGGDPTIEHLGLSPDRHACTTRGQPE